ncbi:MAG: hypothetical protein JXB85_16360 [Anaerolineales bacterium]|nr:hypothetical protein [Anaerolineales bacterium]
MTTRLLSLTRPLYLLFAGITYALGAGIARYLGASLRVPSFWFGLLVVLALLVWVSLLNEYFRLLLAPLEPEETPRQRATRCTRVLQVSYAALTLSGAMLSVMGILGVLNLQAWILSGVGILLLIAYAVPPLRFSESGYGELILSAFLAVVLPAFSFSLHANGFHRLLSLSTFPLALLLFGCLLVSTFPTFATDQKYGRRSLLVRLGWERAIPLHHALILGAYLLLALAPLSGVPWGLVWPVFLTLPFAGLQIYLLERIARGGRTMWKLLLSLAAGVFGLSAYLLALSFWLR